MAKGVSLGDFQQAHFPRRGLQLPIIHFRTLNKPNKPFLSNNSKGFFFFQMPSVVFKDLVGMPMEQGAFEFSEASY